ncbi:MAG: 5'/3'-nucleotidase SurE [Pseudanabaenaceae cyanobacterium SKYGB_i_bin29]|nr:5'/3'-nucleotidase SurE [Pseudanabaenaceae cyanobacterium SKYG29]MDW8422629.1 5'/3'-nucleotidase SurE [Pseudanabaenaceae cyanobacterium SKYGB_i_bin29]
MRILISNDDGIFSPGVLALAEAIACDHEVTVVCPDRERSATGHALTLQEPLRVDSIKGLFSDKITAWACSGTPSDSVKLALDALMPERPELVLSGINRGANLGTDVLYSGTVSAAMEGVLEGLPSIALSLTSFASLEFTAAATFAQSLVRYISQHPLPEPLLLNVNIPAIAPQDICGVRITRLGIRRWRDVFEKRVDPRGKTYYWLSGEVVEEEAAEDSDIQAIRNNYITITPLKYDLTLETGIDSLHTWLKSTNLDSLTLC